MNKVENISHAIKHVKDAKEKEMKLPIIALNVNLIICLDPEIILTIIV